MFQNTGSTHSSARAWHWLCLACCLFVGVWALNVRAVRADAASDASLDSDGDGLLDALELQLGTDPHNPDTDGDGYPDGLEAWSAYSPTSTAPIHLEKSIHVNLTTQRLEPRVANVPLASYSISSGVAAHPTPTGQFKVLSKSPRAWSHAAKLWMPYWMHFSGRGHGIHELPEWPNGHKEGADHLGKPASHGCVRLGEGDAKRLYDWTPVGTSVVVEKPAKQKTKKSS